ncbi:polysaccharide deacetylase family protein [Granulosicoccus sp.]|nr:polysaccharide deacetylase family protein [Granulosicoccus sp.]
MDKRQFKLSLLGIAKTIGLFKLARQLTAGRVRILAYHGAAISDEAEFRGGLFMTPATFANRLAFLARHGYPILSLDDALAKLDAGYLPKCATVITIDDGWLGTRTVMAPALAKHGFPATLYLSSYYMQTQTQVFNVAAAYVLWKSRLPMLDFQTVRPELSGKFQLDDPDDCERATTLLHDYANTLGSAAARQSLLEDLCTVLDVNFTAIVCRRLIAYMSIEEAEELAQFGIDVQLHTHRHCFSGESMHAVRLEIEDNRRAIKAAATRPLVHFCYPSGEYEPEQPPWLKEFGIASATTTQARFNRRGGNVMELGRFLDAEQIEELEFDAEMSGFYELLRALRIR